MTMPSRSSGIARSTAGVEMSEGTGGMTPYDWPSQYGISPLVSMTMWHVSPVALGPTIRSTETILPLNGFLLLKVFRGRSPFSSSTGTLFLLPVFKLTATSCALICRGLLAGACCLLALHCTAEPKKDCAHTPAMIKSPSKGARCSG